MPATQLRGTDVYDGSVCRVDLNVADSGKAVIRRILEVGSSGVKVTNDATGADAGTGDVKLALDWTLLSNTYLSLSAGGSVAGSITLSNLTASQYLELNASKVITSVAKSNAFNKAFGTTASTVAEGNHGHDFYVQGTTTACSRGMAVAWVASDPSQYKSGFWEVTGAAWTPTTGYFWGITSAHTSNTSIYNYGSQLIVPNTAAPELYIRTIQNGVVRPITDPNKGWVKVYHDANFVAGVNYAAAHSHPYLLLTGGDLTGYLTFSGAGDYLVQNNKHAFKAYADQSYGLKFDATNMLYAFTTATTNAFSVGVSTGNVIAKGSVTATGLQVNGIGANTTTWIINDDWNVGNTVTLRLGNFHSTYKNYSPYIRSTVGGGIDQYTLSFGGGWGAEATDRLVLNQYGGVFTGSVTATGLTINGVASFATDYWHTSTEGKQRFYFSPNGTTYIKGSDLIFRNNSDTNLLAITGQGNATFTGSVTATQINSGAKQLTDWNTGTGFETFIGAENNALNRPMEDFTYGIRLKFHRSESAYHTDLVSSLYNDRMFFRRKTDSGYQTWRELWHSGNYNPANYLPIAGGTLTGGLYGTTASFSGQVTGGALALTGSVIHSTSELAIVTANGASYQNLRAQNIFSQDGISALNNISSGTLIQAPVLWTTGSIIYSPAELIVISPVDASYQSIHVNNGKFEGIVTATTSINTKAHRWDSEIIFTNIANNAYQTIHAGIGTFEGSVTGTLLSSTNSGIDGTYSTVQTIYNANYPTYKHTWLSSISSTEVYNGLILKVSTGPSTDKEILKITPSGMSISGVGSSLYFDTLDYPATNYIKTVNDYDLLLFCGRGSTSSLTLNNDGKAYFSGGINFKVPNLTVSKTGGSSAGAGLAMLSPTGYYGLFGGVSGLGDAWLQVGRNDGDNTLYNLNIQTLGGSTNFGGDINIGTNKIVLGAITALGTTFANQVQGSNNIGSSFYAMRLTRSAAAGGGLNRPDVFSVNNGNTGYGLRLGRSEYLTDIIIGSSLNTHTVGSGETGSGIPANPYIRFVGYGDGILITNTEAADGGVVRAVNTISLSGNILGANTITNETDTFTGTAKVSKMITLSQSEYDGIGTKDANTLYIIV